VLENFGIQENWNLLELGQDFSISLNFNPNPLMKISRRIGGRSEVKQKNKKQQERSENLKVVRETNAEDGELRNNRAIDSM
jgi:hypothetical protein